MTFIIRKGAAAPANVAAYQIARSLRFHAADSPSLRRTMSTVATNGTKKLTISFWMKIAKFGAQRVFWNVNNSSSNWDYMELNTSNKIAIRIDPGGSASNPYVSNTALLDPTAWYHIVISIDTAQGTTANRCKVWINGVLDAGATNSFSSNQTFSAIASGNLFSIGHQRPYTNSNSGFFDGYLAEYYYIDGQALSATDFGETDVTTSVWVPKAYTGSFGNNSGWWSFANNASTAALGYDDAGGAAGAGAGSNDLTSVDNFSVSAGVGNDSLTDTPTNYGTDTGAGGEVRGNFMNWSLLPPTYSFTSLANANTEVKSTNSGDNASVAANFPMSSGKWYWEIDVVTVGRNFGQIGVYPQSALGGAIALNNNGPGVPTGSYGYSQVGTKYTNNSGTSYGSSWGAGDVIGVALDLDNGKIWFRKNGTWQNSGNPAAGTGEAYSGLSGMFVAGSAWDTLSTTGSAFLNAGQRPFANSAPTGFKAVCTHNLANTTVALPSTFTGNANTDGPVIFANGEVLSVTINGNVATEGTHYRKIAGGIKIITSSSSYNASGSNTITAATYGKAFKYTRAF